MQTQFQALQNQSKGILWKSLIPEINLGGILLKLME